VGKGELGFLDQRYCKGSLSVLSVCIAASPWFTPVILATQEAEIGRIAV
jgi:hypothetical protein